jgi:hypothetical protein
MYLVYNIDQIHQLFNELKKSTVSHFVNLWMEGFLKWTKLCVVITNFEKVMDLRKSWVVMNILSEEHH